MAVESSFLIHHSAKICCFGGASFMNLEAKLLLRTGKRHVLAWIGGPPEVSN